MRKKLNITEGIFPMPVLMVATYNEDGSVNVMNAAWGTMQARDTVADASVISLRKNNYSRRQWNNNYKWGTNSQS